MEVSSLTAKDKTFFQKERRALSIWNYIDIDYVITYI